MRTIIHIGHHKTATTTIQHYLQQYRKQYIDKGLYVPNTLIGNSNPNHFMLSVYALNDNRFSTKKIKILKTKGSSFFKELPKKLEASVIEHYTNAQNHNCNSVIWSNEGLFLLNSVEEYTKLKNLLIKYSSEIVCVCCFRDIPSFKASYTKQLQKKGLALSNNKDSYRYLKEDSWLFNFKRKKSILEEVFEGNTIFFDYNKVDMVSTFMSEIGYSKIDNSDLRLNITD